MAPPRHTFCRRGHLIDEDPYVFPNGKRVCRLCRAILARARHAKRHLEPGLIPLYGQSFTRAFHHYKFVILRRARFGRSLMPSEQRAAQVANGHRLQQDYPKGRPSHCRRGHRFTSANTRHLKNNRRSCRTCEQMRSRRLYRPQWIEAQGVKVSIAAHDRFHRREVARLRSALIAAHPDKGGSTAKFIRAKRAMDRFLLKDAQWYQQFDLVLPGKMAA